MTADSEYIVKLLVMIRILLDPKHLQYRCKGILIFTGQSMLERDQRHDRAESAAREMKIKSFGQTNKA